MPYPKQMIWKNDVFDFLKSTHLAKMMCETNDAGLWNQPQVSKIEPIKNNLNKNLITMT